MSNNTPISTVVSNQPQIQEFQFNTNQIRVINKDGELWFLAPDVCRVLGLSNTTKAMLRLDEDEYALTSIQGITKGNDQVNLINESGLYSLALGSRKPVAKEFKRWVTHEVLPSIRKTGRYSVSRPHEQLQLDTPLTKDQRKKVAGLVAIFSQHSHYNRMECWQLLHAKFEVNTVEDLKASQYQPVVDWLEAKSKADTQPVLAYKPSIELNALEKELTTLYEQLGDSCFTDLDLKNPNSITRTLLGIRSYFEETLRVAAGYERMLIKLKKFEADYMRIMLLKKQMQKAVA